VLENERRGIEAYETHHKRLEEMDELLKTDPFIPERYRAAYSGRWHFVKAIVERAEQLGKDPLALTVEEQKDLLLQGRILTAEERQKRAGWERSTRESIDKMRVADNHRPQTDDMWNGLMVVQMEWREEQERLQTRERRDTERAAQNHPALTDEQWREWAEKEWLEEYLAPHRKGLEFYPTPEEMEESLGTWLREYRSRKKPSLKQWYETHVLSDSKRLEQKTFWEVIGELIVSLLASVANSRKDKSADKK
jgi:hypothetical protein